MRLIYALLTPLLLPLVGVAWVVRAVVMPLKRGGDNGMVYLRDGWVWRLYSPFFMGEVVTLEGKLRLQLVVKMGNDGIDTPPLEVEVLPNVSHPLLRESTLFWFNLDSRALTLTPQYLEIAHESVVPLIQQPQTLEAHHYYESEPILALDSRNRRTLETVVVFAYEGTTYALPLVATRMTHEEFIAYNTSKES
ncbi:MAG: hypothetical protein KU37_08095 [Sulfuricurvum sp. PC08-66]|nr:MAG: hypothetical protein KU37_08095 [Sulfuricurvum sp. PC08-66]